MSKLYEVCPVGMVVEGLPIGQHEWDQYVALLRTDPGFLLPEEELEGIEEDPEACGEDIAKLIADGKISLDGRTSSQKKMDAIVGGKVTALDKQFGLVRKAAEKVFGNGKKLREHLEFGEEVDTWLTMYVSQGNKRSAGTARASELLYESGYSLSDISIQGVNDNIACYNLVLMITSKGSMKEVSKDFTNSIAYRTLEKLKVAIERDDDTTFVWVAGWIEPVRQWVADGLRGKVLDEAIKAHKEDLKKLAEAKSRSTLSPQQILLADQNKLAKEKEKKISAANTAAESVIKATKDANMSPDDVMLMLVQRGVIIPHAGNPADVSIDNLSPEHFANKMTTDFASKFGDALVKRGNREVIMGLSGILREWVLSNQDAPKLEPALV